MFPGTKFRSPHSKGGGTVIEEDGSDGEIKCSCEVVENTGQ